VLEVKSEKIPHPGTRYVYDEDPSAHTFDEASTEALEQLAAFRRTQNRKEETA
jgi:hypothetical protein